MHPRVLDRTRSFLLVIDVQEAYRGQTFGHEGMLRGVRQLIEAAKVVNVPILATEQYPKGLGHLLPEVQESLPAGTPVIEKMSISCCGADEFCEKLSALDRQQVLVCGIETHACVSQTTHELLARGHQVHVAHDAISSRFEKDHRVAWEKLLGSGAVPTTVELACLEWVRTAASPDFKAIHKIIK
jgi:nicotinamidase-related amidase